MPPFSSARSISGDQRAGRREADGAVELLRRLLLGPADPRGAELARQLLVPLRAREDIHLALPVPRDLQDDVRRRAEAVQAEPKALSVSRRAARPDAASPQRAIADDPRAEQRRGFVIAVALRDRIREIRRDARELSEAAVRVEPRELRLLAEIFISRDAEPT